MSIDLRIVDDDLSLNTYAEPELTHNNTATVAQDIRHMIRERGYAVQLVAEMGVQPRAILMKRIEIEIEEDQRIQPGTAAVSYAGNGIYLCRAETAAGEAISIQVAAAGGQDGSI